MRRFFGKPEPAWIASAAIAGVLLAAAILLPLWRMELVAPQYPEGLVLYAYGDHFAGDSDSYYDDIREINGLNHYIGMKPIEKVTEMALFIPGMIATIVAIIAVSFVSWKRTWFRAAAIAGIWFLPVFFVVDLQYWLYNYGHSMDADAPLNTGDFTPKVIGTTQVWNFHSETGFEIGFYLMVAAAFALSFGPHAIRWAQKRWQRREQPVGTHRASSGEIQRRTA
jgi:copper chaperone NosL